MSWTWYQCKLYLFYETKTWADIDVLKIEHKQEYKCSVVLVGHLDEKRSHEEHQSGHQE